MSSRVVYFNGRYVAESDARVPLYDSALIRGDMAFDVTRTYAGRPYRLGEHIERLFHSLAAMRIDPGLTPRELESVTLETLARNAATEDREVDWNIIHNISRGPAPEFRTAYPPDQRRPTVIVSCYPLLEKMAALAEAYVTGVELVVPEQRAIPGALLDATIKTRSRLHYQLANIQAAERSPGAMPLLVDPAGWITETTSGNVFVVLDGRLHTPPPGNLLPGVTRQVVLALAAELEIVCEESQLTRDDALAADELFVTSTSIGIVHARSLDGQLIRRGALGPLTARLRAALVDEVGLDFAAQAREYARRLGLAPRG